MRKYLVGVIAFLALTLTSLGLAAGSPSTGDNGPSGVSSPDTSTASGRCSKAEAIAAVKRLGLSDVSPTYPVWKVLCGSFTGAGSRVMVASISGGPENVGLIYWAVFRWSGSDWRLLMKQRQAAILTAAGSDIRETVNHREGDPRCCVSGGEKSRIWHWNGTRLVAGPWKLTLAKLHLDNFLSPDRNIWCRIIKDVIEDDAWCASKAPVRLARLKRNGTVAVCNGTAGDICFQNWDRGAPVLRYGQQTEFNGFRCTSETKGITCTVIRSGKGFLINRGGVSRVGP